eukprot:m.128187 g.128187  ORF g.128187 m.128187 type:complete len:59 (-) comp17422_c0_seq4:1555-1731(-)
MIKHSTEVVVYSVCYYGTSVRDKQDTIQKILNGRYKGTYYADIDLRDFKLSVAHLIVI